MTDDELVADYLSRLRRAMRTLPWARRNELLDEISTHIAEARAAGAVPLRGVLAALGDPAAIAAAAGAGRRTGRLGWQEIAAVALLLGGGFIFLIGWFAGLVLLWSSPRWRWPDKLLGSLVWPGGYAGLLFFGAVVAVGEPVQSQPCTGAAGKPITCTSTGGGGFPTWATVVLLVIAVAGPAAVAIRLVVSGRRLPGPAEPRILEGAVD
jgi:hypothetical protein